MHNVRLALVYLSRVPLFGFAAALPHAFSSTATAGKHHATPPHAMASQSGGRESTSKKASKKRRDSRREPRRLSLDIPERFKDGDDAEEDVTAPKRSNTMSMNQSIFSMIARAGQQSQTDLGVMQEVDSGESEDDGKRTIRRHRSMDGAARLSRLSSANTFPSMLDDSLQDDKADRSKAGRLRTFPKLKMSNRKNGSSEAQASDQMSSSQLLPPQPSPVEPSPQEARHSLSTSKAKITPGEEVHVEKEGSTGRKSRHGSSAGLAKTKSPLPLAQRLQQVFEFDVPEEVISEYPCWLLQSILLQGYMYITQKHICFYAYIPKKHVSCVCDCCTGTF